MKDMLLLSLVYDKNFRKVRKFVTMFDPEYEALFVVMWGCSDLDRIEIITRKKVKKD